jgi:lipopolysaccharide/colanic/teichoic acid biosynthesis glycosyltransferase
MSSTVTPSSDADARLAAPRKCKGWRPDRSPHTDRSRSLEHVIDAGPDGNGRTRTDDGRLQAVRLVRWTQSERVLRGLNVVAALVGLILTAPAMAVIALVIKLTSRGPVLYAQTRVGVDRRNGSDGVVSSRRKYDLGGKPFRIYKFRSMYQRPDGSEEQVWARPDDPRVTPLGRLLRQFRLDELPQLFNVLSGDMNVVGPRPEQPEIFVELTKKIESYAIRQRVQPGITGWAQVNLGYDGSIDDVCRKVEYDLEYIARRSLLTDLEILLRTIPTVLFQRGAW